MQVVPLSVAHVAWKGWVLFSSQQLTYSREEWGASCGASSFRMNYSKTVSNQCKHPISLLAKIILCAATNGEMNTRSALCFPRTRSSPRPFCDNHVFLYPRCFYYFTLNFLSYWGSNVYTGFVSMINNISCMHSIDDSYRHHLSLLLVCCYVWRAIILLP